jgi:Fungal protein kinase
MRMLVAELCDAVFESPSLLDNLYPLNDTSAETDITNLADEYFPSSGSRDRGGVRVPHSSGMPKLDTSLEAKNYEPLVEIFNRVIGKHRTNFHSCLNFAQYRKCMEDVAGLGPLKPDLIATHGVFNSEATYAWRDIHVVVEVNRSWSLALKQAAAYGRSMLEQDKRWYSVVIVYNHAEQTLRFTFYNRCGMFVTPALCLTKPEGFKAIARGLVGMTRLSRYDAGIDEHHLVYHGTSHIYLPSSDGSGNWWRVLDTLCQRICVRGRGTHVYTARDVRRLLENARSERVAEVTEGVEEPNVASTSRSVPEPAIPHGVTRRRPMTRSQSGLVPASQGVEALNAASAPHSITVLSCAQDNVEVTKCLEELDVASPPHSDLKAAIPNGVARRPVTPSQTGLLPARVGVASARSSSKESQPSPSLLASKGIKRPLTLESLRTEAVASAPKRSKPSPSLPASKDTKGPKTLESPRAEALASAPTRDSPETSHFGQVLQYDAGILEESPAVRDGTTWPKLSTNSMACLVLKESWPYSDRAMLETNMFADVQGAHGIPVVIGSVNYPTTLNVFTGLRDLALCGDFKEVYSDREKRPETVSRALVRMICGTQGTSLRRLAHEPKRVVKVILDAMIGMILGKLMVHVLIDWL